MARLPARKNLPLAKDLPLAQPPKVVMGRVMAAYGVHGWMKVRPYSQAPDALLEHSRWWLAQEEQGPWREFEVVSARQHGDTLIAQFADIADREAAAIWRGALVALPRTELPALADGEFLWSDLLGMRVVNRSGQALGEVVGVLDAGAHPVLRVAQEGGERLVPFVGAFVDAIDAVDRRIDVDWELDY